MPDDATRAVGGSIVFRNDKIGWTGGSQALFSTDGGQSWSLLPDFGWTAFAVAARNPSEVWFAGSNGGLRSSKDDGQTWSDYSASLPAHNLYALTLPADGSVIIAGEDGLIFGLPLTVTWRKYYLPLVSLRHNE